MSTLYFKVEADYEKVLRLREECKKLEDQLRKMNATSSSSSIKKLEEQLSSTRKEMKELVSLAAEAGAAMENNLKKKMEEASRSSERFSLSFGKLLGVIGGVTALKQLGSEVIRVRGEFESMQTSIGVLLGDNKDQLDDLMKQIKDYALISPLNTKDMAGALKMMMGFGIEAQDSIKYLKAMGDISMGDTVHFNSLALAFSQMSAAGKLMGQDLNQMINAGFNPLKQISEKTGVEIGKLKEQMSKGAISAQMVQQAFIDATSEGGKFFGMAAEGAKTIPGQISMMQEATEMMLNEIGKSSQGVIIKSTQAVTALIENYETVGKVLVGLVGTYGVYRTALALTTMATSKHTLAEIALTNVRIAARKAQMLLNASMLTNPYVAVATAIAGLVAVLWTLRDSTTAAERAQKKLNDEQEKFTKQEAERKNQVESLIRVIQDESETELAKVTAYEQLQKLSPSITSAYKREELAVLDLAKANKILNQERDTNVYDNYVRNIEESEQKLKKLRAENGKALYVDMYTGTQVKVDNSQKIAEEEAYLAEQKKGLESYSQKILKANSETTERTYKKAVEEAKEAWEEAKAEYDKIERDKDAKENEVLESRKKKDAAREAYERLTGQRVLSQQKKNERNRTDTPKPMTISVQDEDVSLITPEEIEKDIANERNAMNEYLKEYGTFMQKRQAIIDIYNDKMKNAETEGAKLTFSEQMKQELADLDAETEETTNAIVQLFGDMSERSLEELIDLTERGSEALEFLRNKKWNEGKGIELGITKEQFEIWSKDPEKMRQISVAFKENKEAADKLRPAYDQVAEGLKRIINAGNEKKKLSEALELVSMGVSNIKQSVDFLSNSFSKLGDAFGSDLMNGVADGLNVAMDTIGSAMNGAKAGAMFGPISSAAGAAIGVVSSLGAAIAKIHDAKNEKRIQRLQNQIDVLDHSYEKLDKSIQKAYSNEAKSLIEDQNTLLEQQKVLIQNQIKEEEDKKKTDKDRIKDWQEQINDINEAIADNKEKAVDAIFGEDLKSAIDSFSSAYAEAWTSGENRAESAKEVVKRMMQQMVTESIKAAVKASGSMEKIRQKLQEFYADNVLSGWEQDYIYNMAEELQKDLDKQFGWAESLFDKDKRNDPQKATAGGFETMSQETGSELNGRFTALQETGVRVEMQVAQQTTAITEIKGSISDMRLDIQGISNIADETRTILANSYLELQQIRENTGAIVKPIKEIQKDIAEVKLNTSKL